MAIFNLHLILWWRYTFLYYASIYYAPTNNSSYIGRVISFYFVFVFVLACSLISYQIINWLFSMYVCLLLWLCANWWCKCTELISVAISAMCTLCQFLPVLHVLMCFNMYLHVLLRKNRNIALITIQLRFIWRLQVVWTRCTILTVHCYKCILLHFMRLLNWLSLGSVVKI